MSRKERSASRNEWNAYVAWSNARNAQRMGQVTQRSEDAPIIPQFKNSDAPCVAHNEALTTENV